MATSTLGPTLAATLITPDLQLSATAYIEHLHQQVHSQGQLSMKHARQWGLSELTGAPYVWLANELGERWLRIIEVKDAPVADPFRHRGWMSLEICVQDVDALRPQLDNSPFEVIGEPANLDVSDDIRAMQVVGPAGEVLYLTEVKAPVPPFELPFARCAVDRLFIPVLLTNDRDRTLSLYELFPNTAGLKFDTRITVINRARQLDIEQKHPVSTIQLKNETLIEIDQLDGLEDRPAAGSGLPAGIAMITLATEHFPAGLEPYRISNRPSSALAAGLYRGEANELIELIQAVEIDSVKH